MNINNWKLARSGQPLAQVMRFVAGLKQEKVVTKSLSGVIYIQTIGSALKFADVKIMANRENMALVNKAEADGAVITVIYRDVRYTGFIEETLEWDTAHAGEWYITDFKLLIETEEVL